MAKPLFLRCSIRLLSVRFDSKFSNGMNGDAFIVAKKLIATQVRWMNGRRVALALNSLTVNIKAEK